MAVLVVVLLATLAIITKYTFSKESSLSEPEIDTPSPIVYLQEYMKNRNKDIVEYIQIWQQARADLMDASILQSEIDMIKQWAIEHGDRSNNLKNYKDVTLTITFYTSLESENGKGRANMNAIGGKLVANQSIAAPRDIPFGSVLEIEGYGNRIVDDRGSKKYIKWLNSEKTHMKVDLYVARNSGETDSQYWQRVNNMGVIKNVKAKLYIGKG